MSYKLIEKNIDEVKPGDILADDIGVYPHLKQDTMLDDSKIKNLVELKIKYVKIKVPEEEKERPVIDLVLDGKSYDKDEHVKQIEDNIEKAYYTSILERGDRIDIQEKDFALDEKKEVKKITEHIEEAHRDIFIIEKMEKKSIKRINDNINMKLKLLSDNLSTMIKDKENKLDELEEVINDLIEDTGPKRNSAFLLLNIKRGGVNYVIRHSINVCLISLAIAIELTKMMTEKLDSPELKGDLKKLNICDKKIFTKSELIKLGLAALVHDLNLLESFPDLSENTKFSIKDKSKIELHSNNGYHMLTLLGTEYIIRNTVLHHHERVDGTGYPDGLKGVLLSKYCLVLAFADRLEQLMIKSPFSIRLHPHKAIMYILAEEKEKFDNDVVLAFCKGASMYPIGSWVLLSNDKVGIVYLSNKQNLRRPIIKCVYTAEMKELLQKEFIDLGKSDLKIVELIDIESLKMFNTDIENFIFDEREFKRIQVDMEARVNRLDTDIFFSSRIRDVSLGGARILMKDKLKIGDEIYLEFTLTSSPLRNKGIIVWVDTNNPSENCYGIRFVESDQNYRPILNNMI
ncbi:MAG: PilZ domain-containing protein [bacterium]|nr:PilZ domain-containing protein [bacterium]